MTTIFAIFVIVESRFEANIVINVVHVFASSIITAPGSILALGRIIISSFVYCC
jgi:hypothetical protein